MAGARGQGSGVRKLIAGIWLLASALACCGCTHAKWTDPSGRSFELWRFGLDTKVGHVAADLGKGTVEADDYDAEARLAKTIEELVKRMP